MEKIKKIREHILLEHSFAFDELLILEVREELDRLEAKGATHVSFEEDGIIAFYEREESDEEFEERKQKMLDNIKWQEKRELEQLRILKEKYEKQ